MTLGERIRNARGRLSARKLAIAAGISPSFLSDIELGKTEPSVDTLKKIASVLNVSSSFLLEETDELIAILFKSVETAQKRKE